MKKIGVRELKLHLSQYLHDVTDGESILVTHRGKIIARIEPVESSDQRENVRSALLQLASKGHILLPELWDKPSGVPKRIRVQGSPFSDAIIEGRR
jgi:prevent-host-death family protein